MFFLHNLHLMLSGVVLAVSYILHNRSGFMSLDKLCKCNLLTHCGLLIHGDRIIRARNTHKFLLGRNIGFIMVHIINDGHIADYMLTEIWINIGSGNGLMPASTKPLPKAMLTSMRLWSIYLWCKFTGSALDIRVNVFFEAITWVLIYYIYIYGGYMYTYITPNISLKLL